MSDFVGKDSGLMPRNQDFDAQAEIKTLRQAVEDLTVKVAKLAGDTVYVDMTGKRSVRDTSGHMVTYMGPCGHVMTSPAASAVEIPHDGEVGHGDAKDWPFGKHQNDGTIGKAG